MKNIKVSYTKNAKDNRPKDRSLQETYDRIKRGATKDRVMEVRELAKADPYDYDAHQKAKQTKLVGALFQGTFVSRRAKEDIKEHSGLAILDFDKVNGGNPEMLKKMLFNRCGFIHAAWISPSGDGVKATARIPVVETDEEYKQYYLPLLDEVKNFSPNTDKSNKDISRLCFESYDPDILIRDWDLTEVFDRKAEPTPSSPASAGKREETTGDHARVFESLCNGIVSRGEQYLEKNRHNFLFMLIKDCIKFGIPEEETFKLIEQKYTGHDGDLSTDEIADWGRRTWKENYSEEDFNSKSIEFGVVPTDKTEEAKPKKKPKEPNAVQTATRYLDHNLKDGDILYNELNRQLIIREGDRLDKLYIELRGHGMNININDLRMLLIERYAIQFNPVVQYFDKLLQDYTYEQVKGSNKEFCKYVTTTDDELFESMLLKHLVRCVGQGRGELTNRFVFVLQQTKQYTGKSEWIRNLNPFGIELYNEKVDEKEPMLTLSQAFMINLEELESFTKKEANWIKSVISMSHGQVRLYYTQLYETLKRIGSFWGSTNKVEWLDDGENTRWITMVVEAINFNYNNWHTGERFDVEKVWAEAAWLWKQGANYEPTPEEWVKLEAQNKEFTYMNDHDHWVNQYLVQGDESEELFASATNIAKYLRLQGTSATPQKTGAALRKAGYEKSQRRSGADPIKGYFVMTHDGQTVMDVLKQKDEEDVRRENDYPNF